jgi:amino acid transporter
MGSSEVTCFKKFPIIEPTDSNEAKLVEDIIYFKKNFGGIGFWPLPVIEGIGVELMTCLMEILPGEQTQPEEERTLAGVVNSNLKKFYQIEGAEPISGYQNFVTLHRWAGRLLFDVLLVIIAVYALAVVLLFIGVFFSLLYCDPSWRNLAEGNLILFLTILVIAIIAILMFVKKSRQGELP